MREYQKKYAENTRKIVILSDFYSVPVTDFEQWYKRQKERIKDIDELRRENNRLLEQLFITLDNLHDASEQDIKDLEEFSDVLMDWTSNLDCGIYIRIHDALLSLYRFKKDRNNIIKELYKLGMGVYYQNRRIQGVEGKWTEGFYFKNEMLFTEAGSYIKYFERIDDEETKGFIIRALANVAICAKGMKARVAASSRILKIIQDPYYQNLAPGLPWDVYLRRAWQQASSNRKVLSKGDLSADELAEVLEACQVVFEPEKNKDNPNIRWLWPYYEMEYTCGFADLTTTLERMEKLINLSQESDYSRSGLYGNIQLPIYYGRLLRDNPSYVKKKNMDFLKYAYDKMIRVVLNYPAEAMDEFFIYAINLVVTDYYETEGVESYRNVTETIMQKVSGNQYINSLRTSELLKAFCEYIYDQDPSFFDDIDFIGKLNDSDIKKKTLLQYAEECGLYGEFGLIKMNFEILKNTRNMLEDEFQMYKLHSYTGHDDLKARKTTERFADLALGLHSWYNGAGGYPEEYVRNESSYRMMTDTASVVYYLLENYQGNIKKPVKEIIDMGHKQFSPAVVSYLNDEELVSRLEEILNESDEKYFKKLYENLKKQ